MNINWQIISTDEQTNSMVVNYSGDFNQVINMSIPPADQDLGEWIQMHIPKMPAPSQQLNPAAVAGATGTFAINPDEAPQTQQPNIVGSWNEEYLRALIYTVLEEIREGTV